MKDIVNRVYCILNVQFEGLMRKGSICSSKRRSIEPFYTTLCNLNCADRPFRGYYKEGKCNESIRFVKEKEKHTTT